MTGRLGIVESIRKLLIVMNVVDNFLMLLLFGTTHVLDESNGFVCTALFAVAEELLLFRHILHHHLTLSALFRLIAIVSSMGSTIVSHDTRLFAHIAEIVRLVSTHLTCRGILVVYLLMDHLVRLVESGCLFS